MHILQTLYTLCQASPDLPGVQFVVQLGRPTEILDRDPVMKRQTPPAGRS
jgi:hypothetical protein